ncbi:hypothetical protein HanIR_Chr14g0709181 [Helianthus annuus]|nr:hypothetical protein HanIR_Chr14g0709181 [Helianthus annuus]
MSRSSPSAVQVSFWVHFLFDFYSIQAPADVNPLQPTSVRFKNGSNTVFPATGDNSSGCYVRFKLSSVELELVQFLVSGHGLSRDSNNNGDLGVPSS